VDFSIRRVILTKDRKWSKLTWQRQSTGECQMKLMWFHLMPYTELPNDFREKNPSVWVDIHSSYWLRVSGVAGLGELEPSGKTWDCRVNGMIS
jgi:hypothetical protein